MINHFEQQQGHFQRILALLENIRRYEGDKMSPVTSALIEEALSEATLGGEYAQLLLDSTAEKAA
ncbi:hypothetical protein DQ400_17460 [Vreelandella sulfidaeris]|uniref:Uncharacterized protein n=1 Tax=Vreelandella sulfidaeris TaxID=115553 RepID=A0A365TJE0_9GAMM|nr:hypothetical protein [Halomonas sulfidaeris]RBI65572.1 hypothetical protein DQ400_17460 [Halomonas sulfidaeris]|tara:strand:+ start:327 stop:521 length:195 start_codon:yes stop_codon:yes gene_type:complete